MESAKVNGVELEYEVVGSGEPVLLISPVLADGFLPLISEPELADRYQLIRYHKRGWVGSTHTVGAGERRGSRRRRGRAPRPSRCAARAHVAGHSSGAAVAAQLALDHPEIVADADPAGALAALGAQRRGVLPAGRPRVRGVRERRPRGRVGHLHERRRRRRLGDVPSPARRASARRRGPGDQGRGHLLRRRAARPHRVGVRSRAGSRHPPARAVGAGHRHPAPVGGDRRVPPVLAPARRGVHDRWRRPSPAHPATPSPSPERWPSSWRATR